MGGYRIYFPVTNTFGHSNHVMFGKYPNRSNNDTEIEETILESMINNLSLEQLTRKQAISTSNNFIPGKEMQVELTAKLREEQGDLRE